MENKIYTLPELPYAYGALAPVISEEQLRLHHQKHHQAYVTNANNLAEKLAKARQENAEVDIKAAAKEMSFNLSGHILHMMFWRNLRPASGGQNLPQGKLGEAINLEFGSFDRFKKEFSQAGASCEGSGWAALALDALDGRLLIEQVEKHNANLIPQLKLLLVLDTWEHAYYLDYKNDRAKFIESCWNIFDWDKVQERFERKQL